MELITQTGLERTRACCWSSPPTSPGCLINSRVIAMFLIRDE